MKRKIICIYDCRSLHWIEPIIEDVSDFGYELVYFKYPELFLQWIEKTKPEFNDFALIILSSWFSGDGSPNIKLGNYRGLEFYAEERKKPNNVFYKVKTIIVAFADNDKMKLEKYNVKLKKQDKFIDMLDFGNIFQDFLDNNQQLKSQ